MEKRPMKIKDKVAVSLVGIILVIISFFFFRASNEEMRGIGIFFLVTGCVIIIITLVAPNKTQSTEDDFEKSTRDKPKNKSLKLFILSLIFIVIGYIFFKVSDDIVVRIFSIGFFILSGFILFIIIALNTKPTNSFNKRDIREYDKQKRCIICGRRIKTGYKYCWEHRGVGRYGGNYNEWKNVKENKRDKRRWNKIERRRKGTENLMKAFGVIRD